MASRASAPRPTVSGPAPSAPRTSDPAGTSERLLRGFAREPGRSALVRVETPHAAWEAGVAADEPRPAASLLKVPLALAVEDAFRRGTPDAGEPVPIRRLLAADAGPGPLRVLLPQGTLTAAEVLGLCLALSDRSCATWLLDAVGIEAIRDVIARLGCDATAVVVARGDPGGPLVGRTTARDALRILAASVDDARYPVTANALRNSVRDSRIPLGAVDLDVRIAHKTGSLPGVAHDVAVIDCAGGTLWAAFLTETQHDTLVAGYEMGICTRGILATWGLAARGSRSIA